VGLSVAEELERRGHTVDICCVGRVSREQIIATFHKHLEGQILSKRWLWATGSTIYDYPILAALLGRPGGYDLVFEAIGPVVHFSRERTPQLTYVFFPPHPDLMGDGKFKSGLWRFYSAPYRAFYRLFSQNIYSTRILSITEYVAGLCKQAWGVDSDVVYFPVPYDEWEPPSNSSREGVITIGRFSPEKNQIEQVRVTEALRRAGVSSPVNIVGAVASRLSHDLYMRLRNEAERRAISNLSFHPNLPRTEVVSLAHSSKAFLHTMRNEHFGIATVEAIAAGCVPIVHESGGSEEIVPFEELRFRTLEECVEKVRLALTGEFDRFLPELRRHISKFSEATFKNKVADLILSESDARDDR